MDRPRTPNNTRRLAPSQSRPNSASGRRSQGVRSSSADNRRNGSRGRDGWRDFGERVRDFTGRMPLVGRATAHRQRQREINRGWEQWDDSALEGRMDAGGAYDDAPGLNVPDESDGDFGGMAGAYVRPGSSHGRGGSAGGSGSRLRWRDRNFSIKFVSVLALLSVIVGFCCTQSTLTLVDTVSAAVDARTQVTAIEALFKGGNFTDTAHLTEIQNRLVSLNGDLVRLQSAMPGPIAGTATGKSLTHTFTMALDLVQAGRYGMDAALILVPHLKGALKDIGTAASPTTSAKTTPGAQATATATATATPTPVAPSDGLTLDDVTRAQQDITLAGSLAQQALAERQYVNDSQLSSVGLGSVVKILQKMDSIAPKLPTYLGYANSIMSALPDLLGITRPAHFLLFNVDSDELRSTGGFMGNYAVLTVQNGHLVGGVHLKDTATFDCPKGLLNCPTNYIPQQYAWMNADPSQFGMRDSNLSPDFPTSAKLIMSMYQQELKANNPTADTSIDGVIMITPEIIKDILKVTGKLTLAGFDLTVDQNNLQDVIHYYHIQNRNSVAGGTKDQKAIDGLLGSALMHKVATLSAKQQGALMKQILEGISTKDVQLYFNDTRVESLLNTLHLDSSISMPPGMDGLMVTDVNVGATYFSRDMMESVADTITFDAQGNAIHDMTITYKLPKIEHLYTPIYITSVGGFIQKVTYYTGVMRTLVPTGSKAVQGQGNYLPDGTLSAVSVDECTITAFSPGCPLTLADEPGFVTWAARINSMQVETDTVIFHLRWTTPNVLKTANGVVQYNLHLFRQAGSHISYDIKIIPPTNKLIAQPLTAPLKTPTGTTAGTVAEFISASLEKDTMLTVTFTGK